MQVTPAWMIMLKDPNRDETFVGMPYFDQEQAQTAMEHDAPLYETEGRTLYLKQVQLMVTDPEAVASVA